MYLYKIITKTKLMKKQTISTVLLIKDDECVNHVTNLLSKFNCIDIVNRITDSSVAIEFLSNHKTDVLFIETDEIELLQSVHKPPFIIAICANSSVKKLKSYLFNGINDFLFLPISKKNIQAVISKILTINNTYIDMHTSNIVAAENRLVYNPKHTQNTVFTNEFMFFKGDRKREAIKIMFNEVLYIKSIGSQLTICNENDEQCIIRSTLRKFYLKLPKDKFQKINKSIVVNVDKVTKIMKNNTILIGTETFQISRPFIKSFKNMLP